MQYIAIACLKGGVGKTSLTVGLAEAMAVAGQRVLVLDCDSQGASSRWLGHGPMRGLTSVFSKGEPLGPLVLSSNTPGVDLIPAAAGLATLEKLLADDVMSSGRLRDAFADLRKSWDVVLMDTPPMLGIVVSSVLAAADQVIIPVEARPLAIRALPPTLAAVERARKSGNSGLAPARIAVLKTGEGRVAKAAESEVREDYGAAVFNSTIPDRISVAEASGLGLPIGQHHPGGPATAALAALAEEVMIVREPIQGIQTLPVRKAPPRRPARV